MEKRRLADDLWTAYRAVKNPLELDEAGAYPARLAKGTRKMLRRHASELMEAYGEAGGDADGLDEGERERAVPVWVVDGIVEVSDAAESLSQAVECATVGVRTSITDPADFMRGTLDVLLFASEDVYERAATLRDKAVSELEGDRFE